jgi:predicted NAD/FAD-binding protein
MKIAVVGAGIAGLSAAWLLRQRHEVSLFEAGDYLGGHTHTVDVALDGQHFPVDTGFLVFNHRTYPNLTALFHELDVATVASDMSFAVSLRGAGTGMGRLQPCHAVRAKTQPGAARLLAHAAGHPALQPRDLCRLARAFA